MNETYARKVIFLLMKNMNVLFMLFLSGVIAKSIMGFAHYGNAKEFLYIIPTLPMNPWKIVIITAVSSAALIAILRIQCTTMEHLVLKTFVEILISLYVGYALGFSYNGIILVILADVTQNLPKENWKLPIGLCVLLYMIVNYDTMSRIVAVIPLSAYMEYYSAEMVSAVGRMRVVVEALNVGMFMGFIILLVREQVSENARIIYLNDALRNANQELQNANMQLENYAKGIEEMTQTRERNRLAREIHDTLGHALTGIAMGAEACSVLIDAKPEMAKEQLLTISNVAKQGIKDVRRSVNALRPDALEKENLLAAVTKCIDDMRQTTGVDIQFTCNATLDKFHEDEEDVIYRIVQESITNAIRHGHATRIQIDMEKIFSTLNIRIKDNGCGAEKIKKGFGLHHMEERIAMLQGELMVDGSDGFLIEAKIPIRWGKED